jgi:Bacteriophage protein gp37
MNKTKIQWTEMTWNPITGCTKISDGCVNCYAARMAKRLKAMGNPRYTNEFAVTAHEDLLEVPLGIKQPKMIFVNSMSDLFHEDVSDDIIIKVFETMNKAHWHTFQVLTKRPKRLHAMDDLGLLRWSPNIWMGVTVESDKYIDRINELRNTKANIKFLSCEPLLGSLKSIDIENIDWVIVGGESGPKSREMKKEWVIEIKELCEKNEVAFFFKQWGGTNKKKSGRLLDGQTYDYYPTQ